MKNLNQIINKYASKTIFTSSTEDYNENQIKLNFIKKPHGFFFQVEFFGGAVEEYPYEGSLKTAKSVFESDLDYGVLRSTVGMEDAIRFLEENNRSYADVIYYNRATRSIKIHRVNIFGIDDTDAEVVERGGLVLRGIGRNKYMENYNPEVVVHNTSFLHDVKKVKEYNKSCRVVKFQDVATQLYDKTSTVCLSYDTVESLVQMNSVNAWTNAAKKSWHEAGFEGFFDIYANTGRIFSVEWNTERYEYDFPSMHVEEEPLLMCGAYFDRAAWKYRFFSYVNAMSNDYRSLCSALINRDWDKVQDLLGVSDHQIETFKKGNLHIANNESKGLACRGFSN